MSKERINKRDWKKIDSKYKRITLRFNLEKQEKLLPLFIRSNEKYLATFIKKCVLFGDSDYKENEILFNNILESNKQILVQLSRLGNNINQIAIKLNLSKGITEAEKINFKAALDEIAILIYQKILNK